MSFPLQQGGGYVSGAGSNRGTSNTNTNNDSSNAGRKASSMNPSSVDAMFHGLLPAAASPSNPRQLSGINFNLTQGGMVPSARLSQAASMSHHPNSLNSNLGEEIKRLQQLHQLASATSTAQPSAGAGSANQLMQGLLAGRGGTTSINQLGVKNPAVAAHQASMLQQTLSNQSNATPGLGSLSQRDARTILLLSQQQQAAALQQQQQQQQHQQQQQQQTLQQQLVGGTLLSPTVAAQLVAASQNQTLPSPSMLSARSTVAGLAGRPGPGAIEPFPEKLHRMLTEVEMTGRSHIISFVDDGRAFAIHKPNQFFKEIVPLYFRQSRLSSFKRQLNLYGFELISNGPSRGAYFHDLFQRDKPSLCRRMRRVAVKVAARKQGEDEAANTADQNTSANKNPAQNDEGS